MTATLIRPVRDNQGALHKSGERVEITGRQRRANFDETTLFIAHFENGSRSLLYPEEVTCEPENDAG